MSCPAPAEPPISATIRLGTIAKHRVRKFRSHGFNRKSRKPWKTSKGKQENRCVRASNLKQYACILTI